MPDPPVDDLLFAGLGVETPDVTNLAQRDRSRPILFADDKDGAVRSFFEMVRVVVRGD